MEPPTFSSFILRYFILQTSMQDGVKGCLVYLLPTKYPLFKYTYRIHIIYLYIFKTPVKWTFVFPFYGSMIWGKAMSKLSHSEQPSADHPNPWPICLSVSLWHRSLPLHIQLIFKELARFPVSSKLALPRRATTFVLFCRNSVWIPRNWRSIHVQMLKYKHIPK